MDQKLKFLTDNKVKGCRNGSKLCFSSLLCPDCEAEKGSFIGITVEGSVNILEWDNNLKYLQVKEYSTITIPSKL